MNILYYFQEDDTYMTQWQRVHIFDELNRSGHEIFVFNPSKYATVEEVNTALADYVNKYRSMFSLFMTCVGSKLLYNSTIEFIRSMKLPTLLICFDNLHAPYMHKEIAPSFDLVWLTSKETMGIFEEWGCNNILFQPYAANPYFFKPNWSAQTKHSVCFVGSPYGSRTNKLNRLTNNGIGCDVFHNSNQKVVKHSSVRLRKKELLESVLNLLKFDIGRKVLYGAVLNKLFPLFLKNKRLDENSSLCIYDSVPFDKLSEVYSSYALSLNITELRNTYVLKSPIHKIHLRTFEIPMCGGVSFSSYTDELASYFEDGKEIVLYRTEDEFISKAKFYLDPKNESIVRKMKKAARNRAENEHTWSNRFNEVFKYLNL